MTTPDGEDGFTVVKGGKTLQKEKAAVGVANAELVNTFFISAPWKKGVNVHLRPIGTLSRLGSLSNVPVHVTVTIADLAAVKAKGLPYARANVTFHVTVEVGDDCYDEDNPRWFSDSQKWQCTDPDTLGVLNVKSGALAAEVNQLLATARTAVRGV